MRVQVGLLVGVLLVLLGGAAGISYAGADDHTLPPFGMNITLPSYYDDMIYFNDVTRHGSHWISHDPDNPSVWDDERDIPLTTNGYPALLAAGQAARQIIFLDSTIAPSGDYTLTWAGSGEIGVVVDFANYDEVTTFTNDDARRQTVTVDPEGDMVHLFIVIYATDPDDPIRDVHLYLPGTDEQSPRFTSWFLERLEPFSVVRFKDWAAVDITDDSRWDERPRMDWATWGGELSGYIGVPYAVQIELANMLGADMWVSVPHLADDNYVRQLAELIQTNLNPELQVWVEYSNEAWNPWFPVHEHLIAEAERVSASEGLEDHYIYHQYGRRAGQVMAIFDEVFAGDTNRMIGVMGGQAGYAVASEFAIAEAREQGTLRYFDTLSLAPYFGDPTEVAGGGNVNELALEAWADERYTDAEYDAIFARIARNIDAMFVGTDELGREMLANRELARDNDLALTSYEAGQSLVAGYFGNGLPEGIYTPVNRHPRMYDMYMQYLDGWRDFGGETMVLFHLGGFWNGSESFGHMETPFQPIDEAHKYRAVLDWQVAHRDTGG